MRVSVENLIKFCVLEYQAQETRKLYASLVTGFTKLVDAWVSY